MRVLLASAGVVLSLTASLLPAVAAPPEDPPGAPVYVDAPIGINFEDPADGLVALGGPPPELGCIGQGFEDVPHLVVFTPAGPLKILVEEADQPYRLYAASSVDEICDSVSQGNVPVPIVVGTGRIVYTDNDVFVFGPGANTFGGTVTGTVYEPNGEPWRFTATMRFLITPKGDFRTLNENIILAELGA